MTSIEFLYLEKSKLGIQTRETWPGNKSLAFKRTWQILKSNWFFKYFSIFYSELNISLSSIVVFIIVEKRRNFILFFIIISRLYRSIYAKIILSSINHLSDYINIRFRLTFSVEISTNIIVL